VKRILTKGCVWALIGVFFGVAPSFLLFVWLSTNGNWFGANPPFQIISFDGLSLGQKTVFNFILFLVWGFFHSLFAQKGFYDRVNKIFPIQVGRIIFYICNSITTIVLLQLWQPLQTVVWTLPWLSPMVNESISFVLFWAIMSLNLFHVWNLSPLDFLGLGFILKNENKRSQSGAPTLSTSGFYGIVRHPIYTFTFAAMIFTNHASLDRLVVTLGSILYLYFAIPVEEKKLLDLFGPSYKEYRKRVPAVIPKFS